jgi:hypothetical protein
MVSSYMIYRLFLLAISLFFSGCSSPQMRVTYYSDPPGAVLYKSGQRVGYTPQTFYYDISDEIQNSGFVTIGGAKAQWASGAIAEMKSWKAYLSNGLAYYHTFNRPNEIAGREIDERFSLELEQTKAMQRQAKAAEAAQQAAIEERQIAAQQLYSLTNSMAIIAADKNTGHSARHTRPRKANPRKECLSDFGTTACGYGCVSGFGQVKCGQLPGMKCLADFGQIECGYGCAADFGQIKCANKPEGVCQAAYGQITCSD